MSLNTVATDFIGKAYSDIDGEVRRPTNAI